MSASRVWISAMRCGSCRGLGLGEQARARSVSAASTTSIRLSGPLGASCARRPMRARAGMPIAPCSSADLAGDRAEQRGLAGAVAADEADARAGRNARRGVVEQEAAGDADRDIVEHEHARVLSGRAPNWQALRRCADANGRCSGSRTEEHMCVPGCEEAVQRALSRRGFFKGAAAAGVSPRRPRRPRRRSAASRRWST